MFALEMMPAGGHETMLFLTLLAAQICRRLEYMLREHGDPRTAGETLRQGKGSCRDFAMLFVDICRGARIASRFVSGYCISDAVVMCMNQPKFTRRDQDGADSSRAAVCRSMTIALQLPPGSFPGMPRRRSAASGEKPYLRWTRK